MKIGDKAQIIVKTFADLLIYLPMLERFGMTRGVVYHIIRKKGNLLDLKDDSGNEYNFVWMGYFEKLISVGFIIE